MAVFAIFSEKPQPELKRAIETTFPDAHFHWTETVSFVRGSGSAKAVAGLLGIKTRDTEGGVAGVIGGAVVTGLSASYFGWSKATLWEWLKASFEAADT